MGLFSRPRHDTLTRTTTWPTYGPDLTIDEISPYAALGISDVFACVRILSESAASLPLVAYRTLPNGSRERFTGRLADLLTRPAPATTQANLIATTMLHLTLWGNAYWGKFRGPDGTVEQIATIEPPRIAVREIEGEVFYTYISIAEGVEELNSADLVHFRALSSDGLTGLSPIRQAARALSLSQNLAAHADNFAKNGGRPGGILRVPGWRSSQPGAAENIRADWESKFVGTDNSGKLLIVTGDEGVEYTQLMMSLEDAQFIAQRQMSTAEICRIFRVPAWMVDAPIPERGITYKNAESQADAFVKFSLTPWLVMIEQAISNDADLSPSNVSTQFSVDALLRADTATRAEAYSLALDPVKGWMTREEVRQLENLPLEQL